MHPCPWTLALLSAGSASALDVSIRAFRSHLASTSPDDVRAGVGLHPVAPELGPHRFALLFQGAEDGLAALGADRALRGSPASERTAVLMFPGLGDHYVNMGLGLYASEPAFREVVDHAADILQPELGLDLRTVLYPEGVTPAAASPPVPKGGIDLRSMLGRSRQKRTPADERLSETRLAQPALFVIEYALARTWQSLGLRVGAMIGYSVGEYVAACLAGVLSFEDSLTLIARRAALIDGLPRGAMLAVALPHEAVVPMLGEHLSLSAINGPELTVVAGPPEAIDALEKRLAAEETPVRRVQTTHAFHSTMLTPMIEPMTKLLAHYTLAPPRIPYISNVTGAPITAAEATDPGYFAAHMCRPVRFAEGLAALMQDPQNLYVEVGPGQTLSSLALGYPKSGAAPERVVLQSMRHVYDAQADQAVLLRALGRLWVAGVVLDRERLPPLPLRLEPEAAPAQAASARPAEGGADRAAQTERELAALWAKLLSADEIGPNDHFFELGGNSLVATRLRTRIVKTFRVDLPLQAVYQAPTLREMALTIDALIERGGSEEP
ncbi:acyltransferase domain-containing protein [Polyangium sp. 6x1]|uniref:acyltransferase domain-containing protein n=1 Tax=Polyangium sp. 6x1 TaxID=3042689 RepID=UPI0024824746|nr:acyltransferase domain-containing protein [Polyangium sp. 6x1]MDI1443035.1 acyltransferase domain-containing protein [Polyangium sp. 6x1]